MAKIIRQNRIYGLTITHTREVDWEAECASIIRDLHAYACTFTATDRENEHCNRVMSCLQEWRAARRTSYGLFYTYFRLDNSEYKVVKQCPSFDLCKNGRLTLKEGLRDKIQTQRALICINAVEHKDILDRPLQLVSGVHTRPNEFGQLQSRVKTLRFNRDKTPQTDDKHVGIEIEFISSSDESDIREAFIEAGLENNVTHHEDGSVHGSSDCTGDCHSDCDEECDDCHCSENNGHEICVLAKQSTYRSIVRRVCKVLDRLSATVNSTCGLHVHLDMRDTDHEIVFSNLVHCLPLLTQMVPAKRLKNDYCAWNTTTDFDTQNERKTRYLMVNPKAYDEHTTLEIRLHSGTTNPIKIINWVTLLWRIAQAKNVVSAVSTTSQLKLHTKISPQLAEYIKLRIKKFNTEPEATEHSAGEYSTELPLAA